MLQEPQCAFIFVLLFKIVPVNMFFILSKLLVVLIYPLSWAILLLIGSLSMRKSAIRKRLLIAAMCVLLLFSNPLLLNQFATVWDINNTDLPGKYSCAIILGGFVSEDKNAEGYFNGSSDRFIQALKLKTSGKVAKLLFTGGNASVRPSGFSEASWIEDELRQFNIQQTDVLIENKARNTLENAGFSKALLESRQLPPPYVLVTSAFHMRRSLQTFRAAGIEVIPYSSNYLAGREKLSLDSFIPSAQALFTWNFYIKELIGSVVYALKSL